MGLAQPWVKRRRQRWLRPTSVQVPLCSAASRINENCPALLYSRCESTFVECGASCVWVLRCVTLGGEGGTAAEGLGSEGPPPPTVAECGRNRKRTYSRMPCSSLSSLQRRPRTARSSANSPSPKKMRAADVRVLLWLFRTACARSCCGWCHTKRPLPQRCAPRDRNNMWFTGR